MNEIKQEILEIGNEFELKNECMQNILHLASLYYQIQNSYIKIFYKTFDDNKIKIAKTVKKDLIDLKKLDLLIALFKYLKVLESKEKLENEILNLRDDSFLTISKYISSRLSDKEINLHTIQNSFRNYFKKNPNDLNFKLCDGVLCINSKANFYYIFKNSKYAHIFA